MLTPSVVTLILLNVIFLTVKGAHDYSYLENDKVYYPRLIEVTKKAVENYNKFKEAFEEEQRMLRELSGLSNSNSMQEHESLISSLTDSSLNTLDKAPRFASIQQHISLSSGLSGNVDDQKQVHESLYDTQNRRGPPPVELEAKRLFMLRQEIEEYGGPPSGEEELMKAEGQLQLMEKKNTAREQAFSRESYQETKDEDLKSLKSQVLQAIRENPVPKAAIIEDGLEYSNVTPVPQPRMAIIQGTFSTLPKAKEKPKPAKGIKTPQEKEKQGGLVPTSEPECHARP